jgi:SAM-dependent methyltransferase
LVEGRRAGACRALAAALAASALPALAQEPPPSAPFITTPDEVVERMLALAGTGPADFVVDLGSGDGRIVIAAAKRFGARGLGVDIDARLVARSRENARRAGVADRVAFEERDVLRTDLSAASVVTIYLLPWLIDQLQPKLLDELKPGARIVAHAFAMKGWKPDRSERVRLARRHERQGDESLLYLWIVPAQARGEWQGGDWRLRVHQNFQEIEVEGTVAGRTLAVKEARLEGAAIGFSGEGFAFRGRVQGALMTGELTRGGETQSLALRRR